MHVGTWLSIVFSSQKVIDVAPATVFVFLHGKQEDKWTPEECSNPTRRAIAGLTKDLDELLATKKLNVHVIKAADLLRHVNRIGALM